jgi:hypothetical protein
MFQIINRMLFPMQAIVSCSTLWFSMYMLYIGKDPGIYLPIVTAIIGCWLPNPTYNSSRSPLQKNDIEQPLLPRD